MKKIVSFFIAGMFLVPFCLQADDKAVESPFKTPSEKLSYSMGLDLGNYLKGMASELDLATLKSGIDDGFTGAEPKMSQEELTAVQEEFAAKMKAQQEEQMAAMLEKNTVAGQAYLDENKMKEGVKVTDSGLQYEIIEAAEGPKPVASDTVKVDYVGTLVDGTEFDSSITRGEPAVFGVNQVIPGWSEALQLMEVGSKYRVAIPSDLAYGETGAPPVIQPNSVLVFEITLLSIEEEQEEEQVQ